MMATLSALTLYMGSAMLCGRPLSRRVGLVGETGSRQCVRVAGVLELHRELNYQIVRLWRAGNFDEVDIGREC